MPMEKRSPKATNQGEGVTNTAPQNPSQSNVATEKNDPQRDRVEFVKQVRERRSKW